MRTLVRSGMLAPAGKPAANKIGRDVCGCRTASRSIKASPPNIDVSGWFLTLCASSSAVASGCGIVFVMTAVGGEAEADGPCVSSRLAVAVRDAGRLTPIQQQFLLDN